MAGAARVIDGTGRGSAGRLWNTAGRLLTLSLTLAAVACAAGRAEKAGSEEDPLQGSDARADSGREPSVDPGKELPTGKGFELQVDYYMEPCPAPSKKAFCLRAGMKGQPLELKPRLTFEDYEWGHRYLFRAHESAKGDLVLGKLLEDKEVDAGMRFQLTVDPTVGALGREEYLVQSRGPAPYRLAQGPDFEIAESADLFWGEDLVNGDERFTATFEFDSAGELTLVEAMTTSEPTALSAALADYEQEWQRLQPERFVASVCSSGFDDDACLVIAVERGVPVEGELRASWEEFPLPQEPPFDSLTEMFSEASRAVSFEVDATYSYLSHYTAQNSSESWSRDVSCFVADTLDLDECRPAAMPWQPKVQPGGDAGAP